MRAIFNTFPYFTYSSTQDSVYLISYFVYDCNYFLSLSTDRNIYTARERQKLTLPTNSFLNSKEDINLFLQQQLQLQRNQELRLAEDIVDSIEIPNRGRCKVFIARYSYDPFKQSPNENPEAELQLAAGDFILVFDEMDDDGFYFGELLDGRRGLIPSNFLEKLTGEDLFEFQATVLYEARDGDESTASYPPEFYDAILNDAMGHTNFQHLLAPGRLHSDAQLASCLKHASSTYKLDRKNGVNLAEVPLPSTALEFASELIVIHSSHRRGLSSNE